MDLDRIRSDAGSQFTSAEFVEYCREHQIHLSLAAPKKQYQNHLAERTWQTTSTIARTLLVHARLPDTFWYHAMVYATDIFNVLPVRGMKNEQDCPATPYELFFSKKPSIAGFRVFGCPTVVCQWVTQHSSQGKQTERGVRGIFLGFDANNKGYMIYSPGSRQIVTSEDVSFDEHFNSAIATTWQQHRDSLALCPVESYIPVVSDTIEHTGNIDDFHQRLKRGTNQNRTLAVATTSLLHPRLLLLLLLLNLPVTLMCWTAAVLIRLCAGPPAIANPTLDMQARIFLMRLPGPTPAQTKNCSRHALQRHIQQLCPTLRIPILGSQPPSPYETF